MRRGLWFFAGAGAGVYAMSRARRLKEAFTADGLRDRWEAVTLGARLLRDDVAQAQADKETELRERFGLAPHGLPELTTAPGGLDKLDHRKLDHRKGDLRQGDLRQGVLRQGDPREHRKGTD